MRIINADYGTSDFQKFIHLKWDKNFEISSTESPEALTFFLSPERQFFTHGVGKTFLLINDSDQAVGRIYASVDQLVPALPHKIGSFGFFICEEKQESIKILLSAAGDWLKSKGCQKMWGPINFNIYVGYRLQTKGFQMPAFLGEPRSPETMKTFFECLGMQKMASWNSWDIPMWRVQLNGIRLMGKKYWNLLRMRKSNCHAVAFDMNQIDRHLHQIYVLFMKTFNKNFLFTEISFPEFAEYFTQLSRMLDSSSPLILNDKDEVVGFAFNYANPVPMNGKRTLVMHTMCINQSYRGAGVVDLMGEFIATSTRGRFDQVIGALAKEGRTVYDRSGPCSRSYSVYSMDLI